MSIGDMRRTLPVRWRELSEGSINRRIFSAAVTIGVLTLGVKVVSMAKDIIVAASFGTGDAFDAFLIAFLLPTFIMNVVGGSFNAALIPVFIHTRQNEGHAAAQRLFSGVIVLSTGLLTAVTLLLAIVGPLFLPIMGSGFGPEKLALTTGLFYVLLPTIVLNGLATMWSAVLNAGERFALTVIITIVVPVASVAGLLALGVAWGIYALAFGIVVGFVVQLALLAAGLNRQGLSWRPRWHGMDPTIRKVIGQYLPMAAGTVLMSSTTIVDQSMAAVLNPGSVAALSYGNKIVALVLSIGTMALGTAVLPYFSTMVAAADWSGLRHSLRTYSSLILMATIPFTFLACLFSRPLTQLLYQRGNFTVDDTILVSQVQTMYLLQIPFHTLGILFVRLISSLQANHILMWGTVISAILNISLDYALMRLFGITGIALSTTFVYVVACAFLSVMLYRKLKQVSGG